MKRVEMALTPSIDRAAGGARKAVEQFSEVV